MTDTITEGLRNGDMKGMIDNVISIDQFRPKIDDDADVVVVAFSTINAMAAKDLNDFIQSGAIPQLDVEPSPGPDEHGSYKVFVEFQRDDQLFKKIDALLKDVNRVTSSVGEWEFVALNLDEPRPFDEARFKRDVTMSPEDYKQKHEPTDETKIKERMEFLVKY